MSLSSDIMMGRVQLNGFLLFCFMASTQGAEKLLCESTDSSYFTYYEETIETCFLNVSTVINSSDTVINSDYDANGLYLENNKNISFLPIEMSKTFKNLWIIDATKCAIKRIGPRNFAGLQDLDSLWLAGNLIDEIPKDTFKDLLSLSDIDLRECLAPTDSNRSS